jgi:phosphate starvation-inducible protein PhoH
MNTYKRKTESGLYNIFEILKNMENIGLFEFTKENIVRNPIIIDILDRFDKFNN